MMTALALMTAALTLAASGAEPPAPPPVMTVEARGLDLSDPADAAVFADRARQASREFCAEHRALVTPRHAGQPRVCERAMRAAALRGLSPERLRAFSRAGGVALLHQR